MYVCIVKEEREQGTSAVGIANRTDVLCRAVAVPDASLGTGINIGIIQAIQQASRHNHHQRIF